MKPRDWMLPFLVAGFVVGALLLNGCVKTGSEEVETRPSITTRHDGPSDPIIGTFVVEAAPGLQVACVYTWYGLWCERYYQGGGDW